MRNRLQWLGLILAAMVLHCGGGGDDKGVVPGPGSGSSNLAGSFTADAPSPGPQTASLAEGEVSNNFVTIEVQVTDTDGIFGAAFDLTYERTFVEFLSWAPGDLLESDGQSALYQVNDVGGRVAVGASRIGASAVDVDGTKTLIHLTFRMIQEGTSQAGFGDMSLLNAESPNPQPIAGLQWVGGQFSAL